MSLVYRRFFGRRNNFLRQSFSCKRSFCNMPATPKLRSLCDIKRNAFHHDYSTMALSCHGASTTRVPVRINYNIHRKARLHFDPRELHRRKSYASSLFVALQDKIFNCVTSSKPPVLSSQLQNVKSTEGKKAISFIDFSITTPDKQLERKITTAAKATAAKAKIISPNDNMGCPKVITISSSSERPQRNVTTTSTSADQIETNKSSSSSQTEPPKRKFATVMVPVKPLQKMDVRSTSQDPKQKRQSPSRRSRTSQRKATTLANHKEQLQINTLEGTEANTFKPRVFVLNVNETPSNTEKKVIQAKSNTKIANSDSKNQNHSHTYQDYSCERGELNANEYPSDPEKNNTLEKSNTSKAKPDLTNQNLSQTYQNYYSGHGMPNANESRSDTEAQNSQAKSIMNNQNLSQAYQGYYGVSGYGYSMPPAQTTTNFNMANSRCSNCYDMQPLQMMANVPMTAKFNMPYPNPTQTYQNYYNGYGYNNSLPPVMSSYQMSPYAQASTLNSMSSMPSVMSPYQTCPYAQTCSQSSMYNPYFYQAYQNYVGTPDQSFKPDQAADDQTKEKSDTSNVNLSETWESLGACGCCTAPGNWGQYCGCGSCCGCYGCQNCFNPCCNCCGTCGCGACRPGCAPFPSCYPGCGGCGCGPACCACGPSCAPCGPSCGTCGNYCAPCCPCGSGCGPCGPCAAASGPCGPCPCQPGFVNCCPPGTKWNPFTDPPPPLTPDCIEGYVSAAPGIQLPKINMNVRVK